jgi:hypothetical protein
MPEDLTHTAGPDGATAAEPAAAPLSPPGYELLDEIGRGGMGVVYRARDTALGRDVAVKLLAERYPADAPAAQRFLSEARITGQLQHPGIPAVHQVGALADSRPFLAMKLIKGSTLEVILKQRPDPAADRGRLLAVFDAVCQAVGYAHAHRVIHRDLKPANVMVGSFGEVQVMDWGLAKVLGEEAPATLEALAAEQTRAWTQVSPTPEAGSHTQAGSLVGTPAFIPPEQALGEIDKVNERADVFGLGALLAVILTGQPPYVGDTAESVRVQAARGKLEDCFARLDASGAEPELVALCKQCLAFEPADRPADAGAVAAAVAGLRAAADERAQVAQRERAVAVARAVEERRRRRVQLALAASVLALITLGGLSTAYYLQQRTEQAQQQAERDRQRIEQAAAVDRVVDHAATLREQAQAHPEDVSRWQVALVAVEQAEVGDDATARDRLLALRTEIQAGRDAAERDRALLDRLADIRSARSDKPAEDTDAAYAEAFRKAGIDLASLTPAEAGAKIKARPASVSLALAAALDDWAAVCRGKNAQRAAQVNQPSRWREAMDELVRQYAAEAAHLRVVARLADPDPWRNELRTALDQADHATRLRALRALAKTAKFDELGPTSLQSLGSALNADGDSALAESVLRKAQQRHPRDLWVNLDLANVLRKLERLDEAIRFYTPPRAPSAPKARAGWPLPSSSGAIPTRPSRSTATCSPFARITGTCSTWAERCRAMTPRPRSPSPWSRPWRLSARRPGASRRMSRPT